jgi:hypothetical protein
VNRAIHSRHSSKISLSQMTSTPKSRSRYQLTSAIVLIAVISTSCMQARPSASDVIPRSLVTLSGIVRDSSAAIAKVRVSLSQSGAVLARSMTRDDGTFAFRPLPAGDYQFSASSPGYALCSQKVTLLWADQSITARLTSRKDSARAKGSIARRRALCGCRITRPNSFSHPAPANAEGDSALSRDPSSTRIVVKVIDAEDGQIVNRAQVTISGNGIPNDRNSNQFTDANGFAVFANLAPGEYRVLTRRIGFDFDSRQVVVKPGSTISLTIQMRWDDGCDLIMIQ